MTTDAQASRHAERSLRIAIAAALVLASAPLAAAPLCHDLKGLFTPCPTGTRSPARPRAASTPPAADDDDGADRAARPASAKPASAQPASTKPPRIAKTKLCRDLKGLFTPCPG